MKIVSESVCPTSIPESNTFDGQQLSFLATPVPRSGKLVDKRQSGYRPGLAGHIFETTKEKNEQRVTSYIASSINLPRTRSESKYSLAISNAARECRS